MPASRLDRIAFSPTLAVSDLARRLRGEGVDVLDLSAGQPDFPTPEPVKRAGVAAIERDETRYTANAGLPELRRAIVDRVRSDLGLEYEPTQVLVSPGAKASLAFAWAALLDPGDEVVVPVPYWTSYPEQVKLAGGEPRFVDCPSAEGFKLTPERLDAACGPRTRAVLLNYPSNPTGACYDADELAALGVVCRRHGAWIVADEIYAKLLFDDRRFASVAQAGPEIRARTLLIDGMSKSYAMTGWRLGYTLGPPEVISAMGKVQSHTTSNATSITQWAAVEALTMDQAILDERRAAFQRRRDLVWSALESMPGVSCAKPEGAFYAFPDVGACLDAAGLERSEPLCTRLIEQARVAVVPGEAFGAPRHVRVSFAESEARLEEGMSRMAEALGAIS